jgi:hypothetical protein
MEKIADHQGLTDSLHQLLNKNYKDLDSDHKIKATRFFDQTPSSRDPNCYILNNRVNYTTLKERDYFGGRTLLAGELPVDTRKLGNSGTAKFSVVADSSTVEVFILTKQHVAFLAERVAVRFRNILRVVHE